MFESAALNRYCERKGGVAGMPRVSETSEDISVVRYAGQHLDGGILVNHTDHVRMLHEGVAPSGGIWADLGAGHGAFTFALAEILRDTGEIIAVDRDLSVLQRLDVTMRERYPDVGFRWLQADLTLPLDLPVLDGLVMANSLHYVREQEPVIKMVRRYLKSKGRLIVVEYNTDRANQWVPYPISYPNWCELAIRCGLLHTELMVTVPSSFLGEFYAAVSW